MVLREFEGDWEREPRPVREIGEPGQGKEEKVMQEIETEQVRRKPCFGSRHMDFEDCTEDCKDAKECLAIRWPVT